MMRALLAAGAFVASSLAWGQGLDLPHENAVPGGVKFLRLDSTGTVPPYVEADGHRALVVQDGSTWLALPLYQF